jgi:hypothetical protein
MKTIFHRLGWLNIYFSVSFLRSMCTCRMIRAVHISTAVISKILIRRHSNAAGKFASKSR